MDSKGYSHIPKALFDAITFLTKALPKRSVPTFLEMLFGAMLTQQGFVTEAWLAIKPRRHLTSYFKWIQKGRWSWAAFGLQTARLALQDVILGLSRISPCNPRPLSRYEIPAAFSGMPPSCDPVLTNYSCSPVVVVVCFSWCMGASIVVVVF